MQFQDLLGWIAAAMTLATFSMRAMMPLRCFAIASNCAFIGYGLLAQAYPVLVLHALLLPFNVMRLIEMRRLVERVRQAAQGGKLSPDWLRPFAQTRRLAAGERLFERGDIADRTFFLVDGRLAIPAIDATLEPGALVGEIAAFMPDGRRTQTVVAGTACTLMAIDNAALRQLYFQNPQFGFELVGLIARRLSADVQRAGGAVKAAAPS